MTLSSGESAPARSINGVNAHRRDPQPIQGIPNSGLNGGALDLSLSGERLQVGPSRLAIMFAVENLNPAKGRYRALKRGFDAVAATVLLIGLSPLLAFIAAVIRCTMGSPVFFRQARPGFREMPFPLIKFRTMTGAVGPGGGLLADRERLTCLGRLLRKTSLDELPEVWNVLRGDMSLVGPRPLLLKYLPFYTKEERIRFTVRPGITGWAQVNGRNYSPWNERLSNDVWYVANWSLLLDLKILWKTAVQVLCARNISVDANRVLQNLNDERATHSRSASTITAAPREYI